MDNFQIETAQNISITQRAAGVGERILAYLIDGLIMLGYLMLANYFVVALNSSGAERGIYIMIVIFLPVFLYSLLWESFWNGQTPGKAALEIRVVKLDGSKPVFSNFLTRWLLKIIDVSMSSGSVAVVTILFNGRGQRLGDLAAKTTVISEKSGVGFKDTLLMDLPEDYVPIYPQVTILSDKDIQAVKSIYRDALRKSNHRVLVHLSEKLSALLEVTPKEMPSQFIKTLLKDYSYYTQR